jgi:hypothetical protein
MAVFEEDFNSRKTLEGVLFSFARKALLAFAAPFKE